MKRYKKILLFVLRFFLVSCAESREGLNYVKNIFLSFEEDKRVMKLEYYDFSSDDEHYLYSAYSAGDFLTLGIKACEDKNYNFRLCENIVITDTDTAFKAEEVFLMADRLGVSPKADIIFSPSELSSSTDKISENPMYNFSFFSGKLYGVLPFVTHSGQNAGAALIEDGKIIAALSKRQWQCVNILTDNVKSINYSFRRGSMTARLDRIDTCYSLENGVLTANVNMALKEYRGRSFGTQSEKEVTEALVKALEEDFYSVFNDRVICEHFNLLRFLQSKGESREKVKIKVKVTVI